MSQSESGDFSLNFGKHKGRTIAEIANHGLDHEGLRYLDWLVGQAFVKDDKPALLRALREYLGRPDISRSLELALEE